MQTENFQKLKIGISSCPNDTFIFDALYHERISTADVRFEWTMADIKELNTLAKNGDLDVAKVSYFTYAQVRDTYALLRSGGALGYGCGPLLVAREPLTAEALSSARIGIPGWDTTAHLLLRFFAPQTKYKTELLFSEIIPALKRGEIDAGVIIHESRFTYLAEGLVEVADLGAYWEAQTGYPIPLGAIIAKKTLGEKRIYEINDWIRESLTRAFANPLATIPFMREWAQEMDEAVMQKHVSLYVNDFSLDVGEKGEAAIRRFLETADALTALEAR